VFIFIKLLAHYLGLQFSMSYVRTHYPDWLRYSVLISCYL